MKRYNRPMFAAFVALAAATAAAADPTPVTLQSQDQNATLMVGGRPFPIKGAAGDASKEALAKAGGNAFRTWGVDDKTPGLLDEAQEHGLKVVLGIWFGHERHGFDYADADQVAEQYENVRKAVEQFKDHPALLAWALGNEMEGYEDGGNAAIWSHIQACAALVKDLDPNHPTMTVIAEVGGKRIESIHKLCPDIDIVGINTYAGVMSIPQRYREAGGTKPYVVTEFGPPGTWEVQKNSFGAIPEPTSTQKAKFYADAYTKLADDPLSLGSFAFTWGFKQEATATWFGMFLPDGNKTAAVDAMTELWSGSKPMNLCPSVEPLELSSQAVEPGGRVRVTLKAADPEGEPLQVTWRLMAEADRSFTGGEYQAQPPSFPDAITEASADGATLTLPPDPGVYRVYAFIHDGQGGGAMANAPLLVKGQAPAAPAAAAAPGMALPFVVYADNPTDPNYIPSGYMGEAGAITMDPASKDKPHAGDTCLKVTYAKADGWGGVVWQHPHDDWGDKPGGFNLTGAKTLAFHARGTRGGEVVNFGFGVLGEDKAFPDTSGVTKAFTLTDQWKQYQIDVEGKDLSRIKTGFLWSAAAQGDKLEFYLDDIKFE